MQTFVLVTAAQEGIGLLPLLLRYFLLHVFFSNCTQTEKISPYSIKTKKETHIKVQFWASGFPPWSLMLWFLYFSFPIIPRIVMLMLCLFECWTDLSDSESGVVMWGHQCHSMHHYTAGARHYGDSPSGDRSVTPCIHNISHRGHLVVKRREGFFFVLFFYYAWEIFL